MQVVTPVYGFLFVALLLFVAVIASKTSGRLGVPALIFFLLIGWAFGPDLLDIFRLDDLSWLRQVGIIALSLILFSGGMDTDLASVRPVIWRSVSLATVGVLVTAIVTAVAAYFLLPVTPAQAFLLGAIVSSTDAAAVFSVLRSKNMELKYRLRPLLEFESGSNDPMALLLTTVAIAWLMGEHASPGMIVLQLVLQLLIGAAAGLLLGWLALKIVNRISLQYEGLFSVLILSIALFTYSFTELVYGNGLLAVYLLGIVLGNKPFMHKQSTMKFFDGLAWVMQILIFVSLGVILEPEAVFRHVLPGLLLAVVLIFVARSAGVFISLLPFRGIQLRSKFFLVWGGLKGAGPLVFALYPILAFKEGTSHNEVAHAFLNIVYFIVLLSVLLQGTTLAQVAKWLHLDIPMGEKTFYPLAIEQRRNFSSLLQEILIPEGCYASGKTLIELNLPTDVLIVLISRGDQFIMPNGATQLLENDKILVMATTPADLQGVYERLDIEIPEVH
ncbi:MAG: potassium/proton antiporter [Bacteroides sp.]